MEGPRQPAWPSPAMPGPSSLKVVPPPPPPPVHPPAAAGAAASSAAAPAAAEVPAAASAALEVAPQEEKKRSYEDMKLTAVSKYHERRSKLIRDFNHNMVNICKEFVHEIEDIADAEIERAKTIAR